MSLILYSSTRCPWAARAWLALIEAQLPFELVEIDLSVPREPWYLEQINPNGKVPAIKLPDGRVIYESLVCIEYIAEWTGKLMPQDLFSKSTIRLFIEMFTSRFSTKIGSIHSLKESAQRQALIEAVKLVCQLLTQNLTTGPFLLDHANYTLAEVACTPFLARFRMAGETGLYPRGLYQALRDNPDYSVFFRYMDQCLSRNSHRLIWDQDENLNSARKKISLSLQGTDHIYLERFSFVSTVGLSAFSFTGQCFPINASIKVTTAQVTSSSDEYYISYGDVARLITRVTESGAYVHLQHLSATILQDPLISRHWQSIVLEKEGGFLRADLEIFTQNSDGSSTVQIKGIRTGCIVGIYDHERKHKQEVMIDLKFVVTVCGTTTEMHAVFVALENKMRPSVEQVLSHVDKSTYRTVEALAQAISEICLNDLLGQVEAVHVRVSKPSALTFASHAGVSISRTRLDVQRKE